MAQLIYLVLPPPQFMAAPSKMSLGQQDQPVQCSHQHLLGVSEPAAPNPTLTLILTLCPGCSGSSQGLQQGGNLPSIHKESMGSDFNSPEKVLPKKKMDPNHCFANIQVFSVIQGSCTRYLIAKWSQRNWNTLQLMGECAASLFCIQLQQRKQFLWNPVLLPGFWHCYLNKPSGSYL